MSATFSAPGRVVGGGEVAAEHRRHAQDAEEVLGDVGAGVALRLAVDRDVDGRAVEVGRQHLEGLLLRQHLVEVHRRDLAVDAEEVRARRVDEVDADQPVGVRKREAAQHHAVDDAEHRRDAADAEREDDDREGAEGFLLDEDAEADAQILAEGFGNHGRLRRTRTAEGFGVRIRTPHVPTRNRFAPSNVSTSIAREAACHSSSVCLARANHRSSGFGSRRMRGADRRTQRLVLDFPGAQAEMKRPAVS